MSKRAVLVSGLSAILLFGTPAWSSFNTSGHKGVVRTFSAKSYGGAKLNIGAGLHFGQDSKYLSNVNNGTIDPDPSRLLSSNVLFSISPFSFLDLATNLPFYYDWSGIPEVDEGGIGDLEVSTKIAPKIAKSVYYQGYYLGVTIPVGDNKKGLFPRHPYFLKDTYDPSITNPANYFYSSDKFGIKGLMLFTFDIGDKVPQFPLQIHINAGGAIFAAKNNQRNTLIAGLGLELTPAYFISLFADFYSESRWRVLTEKLGPRYDPVYLSPGFRINAPAGLYLQFASDFSLSSKDESARSKWSKRGYTYETEVIPKWGMQFQFGWNGFITVQDDDHDGSKNDVDRCPKDAEDKDGFEDDDGCPDPDNDKDGFTDVKDKCPLEAEDKDGFQDDDGCPDPDNDKDGVADSIDKCPNDVEDFDSFEDKDGCPDLDNDKDGIPDLKDKCPDEPESFNNLDDKDGCPDSLKKEPDMPKQQLLRGINFKSGKSEMTYESYQFVEPLLKQLRQYPEVVIEIRGHSDSVGSYAKNMQLSQQRAESVRQYLISKGIESDRVRAAGFGSSSPIADNRTAAGRAQNRRIEAVRIK